MPALFSTNSRQRYVRNLWGCRDLGKLSIPLAIHSLSTYIQPTLEASSEVIPRRRQAALKAEAEARRSSDSPPDDMQVGYVVDDSDWDD